MLKRVGLLVAVGSSTVMAAPPPDNDKFAVDGHAVTASLMAPSTKVIVGEPVLLQIRISNETNDPMYLVVSPDSNGAPDAYVVKATGAAGAVPAVAPDPMAGNGATGAGMLEAHKAHVTWLLLSEWVTIDKPGTYTVTVDKTLRLGVGRGNDWATKSTKHAMHLGIVLDVAAGTPAQLGTVIDKLGAKMLAANDDDGASLAEALRTIPDPRVVPYFVKAIALTDWNRQFSAIRALAAFKTPDALAALERALKIPGNGRIAAAQSIAAHKSDAGMKILWALRADKDESLRLEVVHALAQLDPPDVVARLTEMTKDPSKMVSGEAKRYLAERGKKKP